MGLVPLDGSGEFRESEHPDSAFGSGAKCIGPSYPSAGELQHAGLLPWPTDTIARIGFLKEFPPDDFTSRIEKTINLCLATESPEELRESASKLKDAIDKMKEATAAEFEKLVKMWRLEPLTPEKFSEMWLHGIAKRTKSEPTARPIADVIASLSAYHEYEQQRLLVAVNNVNYKPNDNDLLDSEQLPYLGDSSLHFVTCDSGYEARIKKSTQLKRIHRVTIDDLSTVAKMEHKIHDITA